MKRGLARKSNNFRAKKSDVFWNLHREEVLKEIGNIMGLDQVTTMTPLWFSHRLSAIRNIIERMSDAEKEQLQAEVEEINSKGYPEEVKRKYVTINMPVPVPNGI
jgi:hypothetical protein